MVRAGDEHFELVCSLFAHLVDAATAKLSQHQRIGNVTIVVANGLTD